MGTDPELVRFESGRVIAPEKKSISFQEIALSTLYQNEQFQIAASASHLCQESPPPYAANFAEIEVDTYTGKVRVIKISPGDRLRDRYQPGHRPGPGSGRGGQRDQLRHDRTVYLR